MTKTFRRPHSYKRKKSIFRGRFFWLGALIFVFIGSIFYCLFLSETFQIKKVIITGEKKVSAEELKQFIENRLESRIFFFRTKSIFLADTKGIRQEALKTFPKIAEVELKRGFPDSLNVLVVDRIELARWCSQEKCFLLDNEGVVFEESQLEEAFIKIVDGEGPGSFSLGEGVIEKDDLDKIFKIQQGLQNEIKIKVLSFIVLSDRLTAETSEGWDIYFDLSGDLDWQLTKLGAVLEEKIPPERRKDLEYIELRFGNFANPKYQ